jgi:phosphatidylinositol 3-kinase
MNALDKDDVSYSVFLERKIQEKTIAPLRHVMPRKTHTWVPDESVSDCYNCKKSFSTLLRKHHCRHCGKIFCYECSNYQQKIPEAMLSEDSKRGTWNDYIASYVVSSTDKKLRVCITCNELLEMMSQVKKLVDVFNILELDIRRLKMFGQVGRLWHAASNFCLSIFRESQYKLPTEEFSKDDKRLLWLNSQYFAGHSKYLVTLIKVCESEEEIGKVVKLLQQPKTISCKSLMCRRNCKQTMSAADAVDLIGYCFRKFENTDLIKKIALKHLVCSDRELKQYIPLLMYNIRYDDGVLTDWLIKRCISNFELLSALYRELNMYPKENTHDKAYKDMLLRLKKVFSNKQYEQKFVKILEEGSFIKIVEEISESIYEKGIKHDDLIKKKELHDFSTPISTPIKPSVQIKKIHLNKVKIMNSYSKPLVIPCETTTGSIISTIHKREGVRTDQFVIAIANLMEILVKEEEGLDLNIVPYNVVPLTDNSGLIELVDDADTLYFIKEKINTSILNYIMEKNGNIKINDLRNKFIMSTAAYCVLTYLLAVGDRHLDNIMVTKDGRLFHIDFGYILGKDPVFWNPSIRITPEIVEAIGGFQSEKYIEFTQICSKIFNVMRRNINLIMHIILLLPKVTNINLTEQEITRQIIKRFMPGESEIDAEMYFVKQLEYKQMLESVKDWAHYHSKEKTISSALNRFTSAISSLWRPKIDIIDEQQKET